jgi:molybdate transport system substrate-binding protein
MTLSSIRDYCTLGACLLLSTCGARPTSGKLTVAAAADLQFALPQLLQQFRAANPRVEVSAVYGSSGNFYSQIRNGAPFDLFLSADMDYPRRLAAEGFAVPDSLFPYAVGRIVVWVPASSPVDAAALGIHALESDAVKHVAIANPQHAPYGRAAEAAIRSLGVYDRVAPKLVLGENIAQTLEFVESGAADAGVVALSLALAPSVRVRGRYWEVPVDAYPRIEQGGAVLARSRGSAAAASLCTFLQQAPARRILREYGFYMPEGR